MHVRVATMMLNRLNIAYGHDVRKYDLRKNYTHYVDMLHQMFDFIWLCYIVVFAKECMDVWSARLLLSSHST